jgi:hypothetical protein
VHQEEEGKSVGNTKVHKPADKPFPAYLLLKQDLQKPDLDQAKQFQTEKGREYPFNSLEKAFTYRYSFGWVASPQSKPHQDLVPRPDSEKNQCAIQTNCEKHKSP